MNDDYKLGWNDEMIIHTIINNINYIEKTLIRLHLRDKSTKKDLMQIIDTIEFGEKKEFATINKKL